MSRSGRRRRRVPTRELLIKETKSREMGLGSPTVATVASDVSDGYAVKAKGAASLLQTPGSRRSVWEKHDALKDP